MNPALIKPYGPRLPELGPPLPLHYEPRLERVRLYLRQMANSCALKDWQFVLLCEASAHSRNAEISPIEGRRLAELRLCPSFFALPPEEQRQSLFHELLHCHLALAFATAHDALSKRCYQIIARVFETCLDSLADALAPCFPLPDFSSELPLVGGEVCHA